MKRMQQWMTVGMITAIALGGSERADGQKLLIDFGNNTSFRGTNVVSPDGNGNFWNSVDSTVYWPNLTDANGDPTVVGFGFGTATNGTDSFNGPAGTNADPAFAEIDAAALGDLGVPAAVFDYFATATFTIQGLDPSKQYDITFFGSHKFGTDTATVYTVYTSNDYSVAVASTNLNVYEPGFPWLHNSNRVATLKNISPQFADSVWIGYIGDRGGSGFLNALMIEESPATPPGVDLLPPALLANQIRVSFVGESGVVYTLQYTTNLPSGEAWTDVLDGGNPVTGVGDGLSVVTLDDPDPADPARSYRLTETP
jgi:hypothetical protein